VLTSSFSAERTHAAPFAMIAPNHFFANNSTVFTKRE
jgi:hypothetical protein